MSTAGDGAVLDTLGMWAVTTGLPEQIETALSEVEGGISGLPAHDEVENVLLLGMGGSGIGGRIAAALAAPSSPVPIMVSDHYELPGFVDDHTLVFAVSVSGETEETLEAATEALHAGGRLLAVCRGGALEELAHEWSMPVVQVDERIPMPRAALGATLVPVLAALDQVGLYPGADAYLHDAVAHLRRRRDQLQAPGNEAEGLARRIGRTLPLFYGGGPAGAVVAERWKAQCNENAKTPAFANRMPELCHNEVAGWGQHGDVTRQLITVVQLRHDDEHPQVQRRFELVDDLISEVVTGVIDVHAQGDGPLCQLLDLVFLGDLVSLHLAAREGIDPGPIPALEYVKAGLSA
jgi:glucose/mannose-6-phosphate isomerase